MLDRLWNLFMLQLKKVNCDSSVMIQGRIFIHGNKGAIKIGENSTLISTPIVNPTSGFSHCYLRTENDGFINIGRNVGISHANITSFSGITIEDNVLIGSGVKIWDIDFHSIRYKDRMNTQEKNIKSFPIHIKEGAFIGACSLILKGVTIGKNSVIGAGSIVTQDIPDNVVWAGNPAKFRKKISG